MYRRERGAAGRAVVVVFALIGVAAVAAGGLYWMSERNHGTYRIHVDAGQLQVQRGRWMPYGFEPFEPLEPALRAAYESLPTHHGASAPKHTYAGRIELDRALFTLLAGWLRQAAADDGVGVSHGERYLQRTRRIPSLGDEHLGEIRRLEGDLAYRQGVNALAAVVREETHARQAFTRALELETQHATDARRQLERLEVPSVDAPSAERNVPELPAPALPESL